MSRFLIKKSVKQIQTEAGKVTLKRTLGPWNLVSFGIGTIIGAGIFSIVGTATALHAGPAVILSFMLAATACAFAALCYAELASILPISGSAYTYAYASLGEIFAWSMGWLLILEYGLASATVAVSWSGYFVSFMKDFGVMIPPELASPTGKEIELANGDLVTGIFNIPAFLGVIGVTLLLIKGVKESATFNNIMVFVKVSIIVLFIAIGVFYVDFDNLTPFIPENTGVDGEFGVSGIMRAASLLFFAYIGFETVSTAAQEAKNPQKDMPVGILGSLVICTLLYMCVAGVLAGIVPYEKLNVPDPLAVAADYIGIGWFAFAIKVAAIVGLSSVMLMLVYGQTRVFYVMSKDGLLPNFFNTLHKNFQTPYINTLIVGLIVAIVAGMTPINVLGDLVSLGTLFAFTIVCFSVIYLRYKEPNLKRPFRCPWVPVVPILGIIACGFLISQLMDSLIALKFFFIGGLIFYFAYGQFNSRLGQEYKAKLAKTQAGHMTDIIVEEKNATKKSAAEKPKAKKISVKKPPAKKQTKKKNNTARKNAPKKPKK